MAVLMSLGGNSAGDGFLIAPLGTTYDAEIALWTDAGTASVTLQASPNAANLVFSTAGPISLSTVPTVVTVHAQLQSASRGDTTIQVLDGTTVVASFDVTSIKHPVVNFNGRFEARFATDNLRPYLNPIYQPPPAPDLVFPLDFQGDHIWARRGAEFRAHYRHRAHEPRHDRRGAECTRSTIRWHCAHTRRL